MSPYSNEAAKTNLRAGIKKMASRMSPAAQVRREFRLGRPLKQVEVLEPMHRAVVWSKATEALADLRKRMSAAKLNPAHVEAAIVFIELAHPDKPQTLRVDGPGMTSEECRLAAFEQLGRDDVITLGMVFIQYDEQAKQQVFFPYQFVPLNARGVAVLRQAATDQNNLVALTKAQN